METRAFRPTPFQVTELSLQQEEAFPGPGLLLGVPGPVSCFWSCRASCGGPWGCWSLAGGGLGTAPSAGHGNHGMWIGREIRQEPTPLRTGEELLFSRPEDVRPRTRRTPLRCPISDCSSTAHANHMPAHACSGVFDAALRTVPGTCPVLGQPGDRKVGRGWRLSGNPCRPAGRWGGSVLGACSAWRGHPWWEKGCLTPRRSRQEPEPELTNIEKQRVPWRREMDPPDDRVRCEDRDTEALGGLGLGLPLGPRAPSVTPPSKAARLWVSTVSKPFSSYKARQPPSLRQHPAPGDCKA